MHMEFQAQLQDEGIPAGLFLLKNGVSKRLIAKLKRQDGGMTRNGVRIRTIDRLQAGDTVVLRMEDLHRLEPNAALAVPVVYEDDNVIVFDKPSYMPVHPSLNHHKDTLGNYFAAHCPDCTFRPVNRLDMNTSGLVLVAKDAYCARQLQRTAEKTYYAVVCGILETAGVVEAPIARAPDSIMKRCVREDGAAAVTQYTPMGCSEHYTLLKIRLQTGRTHQIRVHMAYIGHPLAGDDLYGGSVEQIPRQALHCGEMAFPHPVFAQPIALRSPLPADICTLISF